VVVRLAAVAALGAALGAAPSCGGGGNPSSSTPPTTVAPRPDPTPTPVGGGDSFSQLSCPLGRGDSNATCKAGNPALLEDVESAMERLLQQQPQLFDPTDESPAGTRSFRVKDREAYMAGLVSTLRAAGLCAERDPDDAAQELVHVKSSSDFSVDVAVITAAGYMRRGPGMYRRTCTPSSFPLERGTDAPPVGSGCGRPYPPPVTRFNCKVHIKTNEFYTLDATPLVGPNPEYCYSVGYTDGRTICPVRPDDWPDRNACENWRVGKAKDTGRWGPTWTKEGRWCTGPDSGCANHPDNQYQVLTYVSGSYTVTAENGASCTVSH
jgi:hypothetical protein